MRTHLRLAVFVAAGCFSSISGHVSPLFCQTGTQAAPGVVLPHTGTVAILSADAPTAPVIIHASEIKSNSHAAGNFARSMVYAGPKSGVELAGQHAATVVRSSTPSIFVRLNSDDPELLRNRVSLLMLRVNKDSREVTHFSANIFGGQRKRTTEEIAVVKTDVPDSNWLKIVPAQPLEPGEYGVVFMPKDKLLFADTVYDFSVAATR